MFLSHHSIEHLIGIHLCILQVDWAQNHLYDYIFHQIARPQHWFTCQKHGPYIEMQLPPDVHDNSTWLGFTVYALYGIQMQPAGFSYKLDSTILLHYSGPSVSFAPYPAFPLSGDVFDESPQRLVVFYIPRRVITLGLYLKAVTRVCKLKCVESVLSMSNMLKSLCKHLWSTC